MIELWIGFIPVIGLAVGLLCLLAFWKPKFTTSKDGKSYE